MKRIFLLVAIMTTVTAIVPAYAQNKVMLMNRIGPSQSVLYVANADGTGEHPLFSTSGFDYNASFSSDGKWIVFTSERNGFGQADLYRVHPDGSGLERLTDNTAMDDQGELSPDGTRLAFVSTRNSPLHTANIWILDLKTKQARNLTGGSDLQSPTPGKPDAFLRPSWSPDGKWIAFSSDRNTDWKGAELGAGRGHTQELSIYVIQPDGKGLRRLTPEGINAGSPKWSPDGGTIVCYEMDPAQTSASRMGGSTSGATAQIVSIDVATGVTKEQTSGPGLKLSPQFVGAGRIGYLVKAAPKDGPALGLMYTTSPGAVAGAMRNPAWTPDGKNVVYQKTDFTARPQNQLLYSWDPEREYRYTDVFPTFSKVGKLVITDLNSTMGNPSASLSVMDADGSNRKRIFSDPSGAAMMPSWSPDGKWIVFGFGGFFPARETRPARLIMVRDDGTDAKDLTEGMPNTGFPSWSPDGKTLVYRVWGPGVRGLRLMNLADHSVKTLTTDWDNFPFWSPSGDRIAFTRQQDLNFDVFSLRPDGTDLKQLTTAPGSDGHATWTADGKHFLFSSSRAGYKDEASLYDSSPQPYAQVFIMNVDGSDQHQITDSRWEDSMAVFTPEKTHQEISISKK